MSKNKLRPCPFCGKKAEIKNIGSSGTTNFYMVTCLTSRCYGHQYTYNSSPFTNKDEAVKAWNRRKGEDF